MKTLALFALFISTGLEINAQLVQELQLIYNDGSMDTFTFVAGNKSRVPNFNLQNFSIEEVKDSAASALACSPIVNDLTGKIALVDRGECFFTDKYDKVAAANAVGFLVCNSDSGDPTVLGNLGPPFLPTGMMRKSACDSLKLKLDENTRVNWIFEYIRDCSDTIQTQGELCSVATDLGIISDCPSAFNNSSEFRTFDLCPDNIPAESCFTDTYGAKWVKFETGDNMTRLQFNLIGFINAPSFVEIYQMDDCSSSPSKIACITGDSIQLVEGFLANTTYFALLGQMAQSESAGAFIQIANADCRFRIKGSVFHDENMNGERDSLEELLSDIKFRHGNSNRVFYANQYGEYQTNAIAGLDTMELSKTEVCWMISDSTDVFYDSSDGIEQCIDIGLVRSDNMSEGLKITINSAPTRCNTLVSFWLTVENTGCLPFSDIIYVSANTLLSNLQSSSGDFTFEDPLLSAEVINLPASGKITLEFEGEVANENFNGDTIKIEAYSDIMNQTYLTDFESEIRCAIDPNDKQVLPARDAPNNYTLNDEKLSYKIRFQNTGTDTAFTVVIKDTLSPLLDWNSIAFLSTSHEGVFSLDEGVVTVAFENINLPDSTTNEAESHGFLSFEIDLMPGIQDFTVVDNTAAIYFDLNSPIITNTIRSTIVDELDADGDGFFFWEECDDSKFRVNPDAVEIPNNEVDENCDGIIEQFTDEECNLVFEDFNTYNEGAFVGQTDGSWALTSPDARDGSIFNWGDFNVLDVSSGFNQSTQEYEAQLLQRIDLGDAETISISFNYYNECGILSLAFFEDSLLNTFGDFVITSFDFGGLENALYIQKDTFPNCQQAVNDFVNYRIDLLFEEDILRFLCSSGDSIEVPFYGDANDFYGIGWGSNQCAYVSDICIGQVEMPLIDEDMDGFTSDVDCDDSNPMINPGAEEIANNDVDENCDGELLIIDQDMDGFNSDVDCDDTNASINPEAEEIANNGIDENCDGADLTSSLETFDATKIEIFPNPVQDLLLVDLKGLKANVAISNMNGQLIYSTLNAKGRYEIDARALTSGVYFITISLEDGSSFIRKLVKI